MSRPLPVGEPVAFRPLYRPEFLPEAEVVRGVSLGFGLVLHRRVVPPDGPPGAWVVSSLDGARVCRMPGRSRRAVVRETFRRVARVARERGVSFPRALELAAFRFAHNPEAQADLTAARAAGRLPGVVS